MASGPIRTDPLAIDSSSAAFGRLHRILPRRGTAQAERGVAAIRDPEGSTGLSIPFGMRWGIGSAAVAVAATLAIAPTALAATHAPGPALKTSGKAVELGKASSITAITEAGTDVLFAEGKNLYAVEGNTKEGPLFTFSSPILALAAPATGITYIQTGATVAEYQADDEIAHWTLPSNPVKRPFTSAGLLVVGTTVWSWTDWSTDQSGFEFATLSKINTKTNKVSVVSNFAYPADMSANSSGLYYEITNSSQKNYLVLSTPGGKNTQVSSSYVDWPLALAGGRVDVLAPHTNGNFYINSFSATLGSATSARVSNNSRDIADSSAGLLILQCSTASCSKASVGVVSSSTGKVTGSVSVPDAYTLLTGGAPAVLTDVSGNAYLVRLAG